MKITTWQIVKRIVKDKIALVMWRKRAALFRLAARIVRTQGAVPSVMSCANRKVITSHCGVYEVTLTFRDMSAPDGYSREELVHMLDTVREHEVRQGWRVPEPRIEPFHDVSKTAN